MFINLLKHSFRALKKQKTFVIINVTGLAIGLAASLMIALYIIHELSYDNYHQNKDHIYKLILHGRIGGQELQVTSTAAPIGPTISREFPEVSAFLRLNPWGETIIKKGDIAFTEDHYIEADSSFFDFFSIPLLRGNKQNVLSQPYTVVLSESTALKIFGEEDPIDQMIRIGTSSSMHRVTGIMQDIPANTHFEANMVGSFSSNPRSTDNEWLANSFHTYLILHPQSLPEEVDARFHDLMVRYVGPQIQHSLGISFQEFLAAGNQYGLLLQPLRDIRINPAIEGTMVRATDPRYFWIFGSIGLLILVIASINFMNLSTAQATKRAREVGIKKVSGSTRRMLIWQFILETVILSLLALLIALIIVEATMPLFNQMLDMNLNLSSIRNWQFLAITLSAAAVIGILAGSYPAFYMSSFNPIEVLKSKTPRGRGNISLRSALTVLQFSISIILIIGTLVMHRQIRYMLARDLGFDKENIMVIRRPEALQGQVASFKQELMHLPGVMAVSASTAVPGRNNNTNGYVMRGRPEETFLIQSNWVDYDFLETYGLKLSQGRFFDRKMLTDHDACLLNEIAINNFNIDKPFEARLQDGNPDDKRTLAVIGVVNDFHYESLRHEIRPYILRFREDDVQWGYISIRLEAGISPSTIQAIERVWSSFAATDPMLFFFMDQDVQRQYIQERQNASMSVTFTILAIIIATLGLYGLMSFAVGQRIKEIGVRKTFGASVSDIWLMICREIFILVVIANLIAWPVVYWVAGNWLANYHYRISLSPGDFLAGFAIAAIIALITISYRTIRTAMMNPSVSLRYE